MSRIVAVVGPPSAGVTSLAAALAERMTDHTVVEAPASGVPDVVVVVASAVAPLADSDVDLIARAAADTDLVIAAVTKIDAHRRWRDVLAADRALLARRDERYRYVQWVGVTAAPDLGEPDVDDLVRALVTCLAEPDRLPRARQPSRSAEALAVRSSIQRARLTLLYFVRRRCAEIGADLRAEAAELPRGGTARFGDGVRDAVADFGAEVDAAIEVAIDEAIGDVSRARRVDAAARSAAASTVVAAAGDAADVGARWRLRPRGGADARPSHDCNWEPARTSSDYSSVAWSVCC